jgi:putative addiction module component (TIGR02574 family)
MKTIDEMTPEEKLQTMEALWDSLSSTPDAVPSPEWHGHVLQERADYVASGKAKFSDLEDVKKRLTGQS